MSIPSANFLQEILTPSFDFLLIFYMAAFVWTVLWQAGGFDKPVAPVFWIILHYRMTVG